MNRLAAVVAEWFSDFFCPRRAGPWRTKRGGDLLGSPTLLRLFVTPVGTPRSLVHLDVALVDVDSVELDERGAIAHILCQTPVGCPIHEGATQAIS